MPQGSVLGTLLFLIYINGLIAEPSFQAKLFAGNRIIFTELMSTADQLKLNSYFDQIRKWLEMAMALNLEKKLYARQYCTKRAPLQFQLLISYPANSSDRIQVLGRNF